MRLVRNNAFIQARRSATRRIVFVGMVALFGAVVLTFWQPSLVIPGYILLIIGFILFNTGMQATTKWGRSPRPDEILDNLLRRLNDRYTLIHYPNVPGVRPEHLLVYPGGLLVITTREVPGRVRVELNKWRRLDRRMLSFLALGGPPLGDPTTENQRQQGALRAFLEEHDLPGADELDGLIVFINPRAELEVISSDLTAVTGSELLDAVRDLGSEVTLPAKQREEIVAALSQGEGVEGPVSLPSRDRETKPAKARS